MTKITSTLKTNKLPTPITNRLEETWASEAENRLPKACPLTAESSEMIKKTPLKRNESKFKNLRQLKEAVVVAKSVTFLLLIKKILTTQICQRVGSKGKMKFQTTTNPSTLTTTIDPACTTKTRGKLFSLC